MQLRWFFTDGPYDDELAATFGPGPDGSVLQIQSVLEGDSPDEELQFAATINDTCTMDLI